jgi:intein/homing endonuclease
MCVRYALCMARRWTVQEEDYYRKELWELYVVQNKTIFEVADVLHITWQAVFGRLKRLNIPVAPEKKLHYLGKNHNIKIPKEYSEDLAEFFGIMLGDGHISHFQIMVTLGKKEASYANYVARLMKALFNVIPRIRVNKQGYRTVYFGSVEVCAWLRKEGLTFNKVRSQIDVPRWIFSRPEYAARCIRGFFDTDGSIYRLKHGIQILFCNHSVPLLKSLQRLCSVLGYRVSKVSGWNFYITRISDIKRFFSKIAPQNGKHKRRCKEFLAEREALRAGRPVGGGG